MAQPSFPVAGRRLTKRHSAPANNVLSTLKIQLFIRFSPWRNPQLKYFVSYPFGISKEKVSVGFYDTAIAFQG